MTRLLFILSAALALPATSTGQSLRKGVVDADALLVGRQIGKQPAGDAVTMHRVQVLDTIRGLDGERVVTVLDWPKLSLHNRPMPRQSRLFCLQDASVAAARLGLPSSGAPYFKLVGWPGSHPLIGADRDADPIVRFARVLAASERGVSPAVTAAALVDLAINGHTKIRTEATHYLAERGDLRGKLVAVNWNQVMARATGEVDDIDYKIALATLCGEQRLEGLIAALSVSLGPVTDPRYARCVGRISKVLHGERAADVLGRRLRNLAKPEDRRVVLLAIGATKTRAALDALLKMDQGDDAVIAALREHGAKKAQKTEQRRR